MDHEARVCLPRTHVPCIHGHVYLPVVMVVVLVSRVTEVTPVYSSIRWTVGLETPRTQFVIKKIFSSALNSKDFYPAVRNWTGHVMEGK